MNQRLETTALRHLEANMDRHLGALQRLVRIPSVSDHRFPAKEVERSAQAVATEMKRAGLLKTRVLRQRGAHPYAYGEWLGAKGAPTILIYGHHDVQPPGRKAKWKSPAFTPTLRKGRLYGRGAVDDKAGVMVHLAAIAGYLKGAGAAPVNFKVIVEGEEETGSDNLSGFLEKHKKMLAADAIVLTDTANFDTGRPALTYRLRGIVVVDVTVRGLKQPVHSGMWGGPVPDPALALAKMLAGLVDADGRVQVPGFYDRVAEPTPRERERLGALPYSEETFRRQAGLLDGVRISGELGYSVWERMWVRPSLAVTVLEASSFIAPINQIVDQARARVNARIVPDQDPEEIARLLVKHLTANVPWGMQVEAVVEGTGKWWITEPEGPAFDAARRAMERGYGAAVTTIGCGGSIPFVEPFARVLGGIPALLTGVEDPICNAHSENESLCLADFKKAARSSVYLYAELAQALTK